MFILDTTTRSLEIKLSGAVASTECPYVTSHVDVTTSTYVPGTKNGTTNGGSAVTIVSAPAASTQRQVKLISVRNSDSAPVTLTLQYDDNGTLRIISVTTLPIGASFVYTDGEGIRVLDSNGNLLTSTAVSAHELNHISGGSDPFLSSQTIEALGKRIRETGGPTDLVYGSISNAQYLMRSGSTVIGNQGTTEPALKIVTNTLFK